jgi:hypothetical protein
VDGLVPFAFALVAALAVLAIISALRNRVWLAIVVVVLIAIVPWALDYGLGQAHLG